MNTFGMRFMDVCDSLETSLGSHLCNFQDQKDPNHHEWAEPGSEQQHSKCLILYN